MKILQLSYTVHQQQNESVQSQESKMNFLFHYMNNNIFLDEFAHMLTVEFVRNGQYTVSPFPMKYLRENQCFIGKDVVFDE